MLRTLCEGVFLGSVGLWAGVIAMVGAVAAIAFPTVRELDPALAEYAAYPGEHWRIAAGAVMNRAFLLADGVGGAVVLLATGAVVVMLASGRVRAGTPAMVLRLAALAVGAGLTVYTLAAFRPEMQGHLETFWSAARAGEVNEAETARAAFDAMHPRASFLLIAQLVAAGWAFGAGAWSALRDRDPRAEPGGGGDRS